MAKTKNQNIKKQKDKSNLREIIALKEHDQWVLWSKAVVFKITKILDECETEKPETIYKELFMMMQNWKKEYCSYIKLTEIEKNKDRKWADIMFKIINKKY